ncbi:MAG: coproporphyrinogen dehydrogenase HemZ, partial [Lachnospiraceae bacterium]|nr:coproporphyrinogen dehydrogenase HemZ [Lachnospiraceae bacterium]
MMIIKSNKPQFEYDIHSLIKAFYPEQEVKLLTPESVIKNMTLLSEKPAMTLDFGEEQVVFSINTPNGSDMESISDEHTYIWKASSNKKSDYKNEFKLFLYKSLSEETGIELPWGNLTGIRPTKIAMSMLEEGKSDEDITAFLKKEHLVSAEKTKLSIEIAKRERKILDTLHYKNGYSLYIGIPFCPTTCLYCSFTSYPISVWKKQVSDYLSALEKEIDYVAETYRDKVLDTIYIGGGTPTSLSAEELERLLGKIKSSFELSALQEFTVEAGRADSITEDKLAVLSRYGVTRISVNPQTMKQETLQLIGRQHTVEQVIEAFHMARRVGFDNINMDIILGLPGEKEEDVKNTIREIEALAPDSLTVHSLAIKRAAAMQSWISEHGISGLHNTEEMMRIATDGAHRMSMVPYYLYRQKNMAGNFENVGYAREGKYGIYNILIMEEKQTIVAVGAGTITKRVFEDGRIERCDNVKDVALYIEKIDEMIERKRRLLEEV